MGILISLITVPIITFLVLKNLEKKKLSSKHFQIIYALCLLGLGILFRNYRAPSSDIRPSGSSSPFFSPRYLGFCEGRPIASIFRNASRLFGNTISTQEIQVERKTTFIHEAKPCYWLTDGLMLRDAGKTVLLSIEKLDLMWIESDLDSLNNHAYLEEALRKSLRRDQ